MDKTPAWQIPSTQLQKRWMFKLELVRPVFVFAWLSLFVAECSCADSCTELGGRSMCWLLQSRTRARHPEELFSRLDLASPLHSRVVSIELVTKLLLDNAAGADVQPSTGSSAKRKSRKRPGPLIDLRRPSSAPRASVAKDAEHPTETPSQWWPCHPPPCQPCPPPHPCLCHPPWYPP